MKRIATLILAAGLVFAAATGSHAIEFNPKGQWLMEFQYGAGHGGIETGADGSNVHGSGNASDNFHAVQRVRIQLDAVASESLSGAVQFEMGNQRWGTAADGANLGADGNIVAVKYAYLDWIVPSTALNIRMGLLAPSLPSFTFNSSQVLNTDAAGIIASYKLNDNVNITAAWLRPYNDNYGGTTPAVPATNTSANAFDNIDIFALVMPMTFDNVKISPWAAYVMVGRNAVQQMLTNAAGAGMSYYEGLVVNSMLPAAYANPGERASSFGQTYWVGFTGEIATNSPVRFAWDANYGSFESGNAAMSRTGWYLDSLVEYKMAWGTPALYAWYGSGDDGSMNNGSERMPSFAAEGNDERSNLAGPGSTYIGREAVIGLQWTGTWGVGARIKDMSFIEDLMHTVRINYLEGTNSPTMARYMTGAKPFNGFSSDGTLNPVGSTFINLNSNNDDWGKYITTKDSAIEIGLTSTYQIYNNLSLYVDLEYLFLSMDKGTWDNGTGNDRTSYTDPWNINFTFVYSF